MSIIKAGYRITVTSWENDADNYSTITRDGLTKAEVRFHVDLLKLVSGSNCNDKMVFGNIWDPSELELYAFDKACKEVFVKHDKELETNGEYEALNYAMDIIGEYIGYSDFYTRVAERIVIEYVAQEIVIEDVSTNFGV